MLKLNNVQHIYLNGKAKTMFSVYSFDVKSHCFVFDYNDVIDGHYKRKSTIARKHCENNGTMFKAEEWQL